MYILWEMGQNHATLGTDIEEEEDNHGIQENNLSVLNIHWKSLGSGLAACLALLINYNVGCKLTWEGSAKPFALL